MPELPEVEVVKQGLQTYLEKQPTIKKIEFLSPKLRNIIPQKKLKSLAGGKILAIQRRAKYLIIETEKGNILSHLGMTGTWRKLEHEQKHDHIYLHLSDGVILAYCDPRRFGVFDFIEKGKIHTLLKSLGPEPFDPTLTAQSLWQALRNKNIAIKAAIMDQKILVGVGNIYASEALFAAKIHPKKAARKVTLLQIEVLIGEVRRILQKAIQLGGSSIDDFHAFSGENGEFQDQHLVYDRSGQPCISCQTKLRSEVVAGRNTYWCPNCQKRQ